MKPAAVVMNMYYTGLGIARSIGGRGVRTVGLSAQRGIYGNFTRYAEVRICPDSREDPSGLKNFLVSLGKELGGRSVIFPTRDDDAILLDLYRDELSPYFIPAIPSSGALVACLNKWETFQWAQKAAVAAPRCWVIENTVDVCRAASQIQFPCVLKPLSSHHWRKAGNWVSVAGRKAIGISSPSELMDEYRNIAKADHRALLQELIPGGDGQLVIAACYMDRDSRLAASFTAQKLAQIPPGFGTGCIVQTVDCPEIVPEAARVLEAMRFTGIAEVEFKWDASASVYKLIEINPRPWDQHRLGHAIGADLIYMAYCDLAGIAGAAVKGRKATIKWVAEDVFLLTCLRSLARCDGTALRLIRLARGKQIFAIWWAKDPLPFLVHVIQTFLVALPALLLRRIPSPWSRWRTGQRLMEGRKG
jgi:D-aspartate ligase